MKPGSRIVVLIALLVFAADQVTKTAVLSWIGLGGVWSLPSRPDLFSLVPGVNSGTACGYFPQASGLFTLAPFLILAVIIIFYRRQQQPGWLLSLATGLIIGGAFGNLADRLRFGYVVDFIYVWRWPVFNIADAAVSTAVVLLLYWSLKEDASLQGDTGGGSGSWKLLLSFLVVLGVLAVLGVFVCVVLPPNLPR